MIINAVYAQNLLKFEHLELTDLPAQGLIALVGNNESGKSSLGEGICFGLYGRGFAVGQYEPTHVIRWGQTRCSVTIEFTARDGQPYRVLRFIEADGTHGARLERHDDTATMLARGPDQVTAALEQLNGYGFEEFIESFYLAQREITSPHPHSQAVRRIAGVAPLQALHAELTRETATVRKEVADLDNRLMQTQADLTGLGLDEARLGHLESAQQVLASQESLAYRRSAELNRGGKIYRDALKDYERANRRGILAKLGGLTLAGVALAALVLWALLQMAGAGELDVLADYLAADTRAWLTIALPIVMSLALFGGVVSAVVLVLAERRAREAEQRAQALPDALQPVEAEAELSVPSGTQQALHEAEQLLGKQRRETENVLLPPAWPSTVGETRLRAAQLQLQAPEVRRMVNTCTAAYQAQLAIVAERLAGLEQAIAAERRLHQQADDYRRAVYATEDKLAQHRHRLRVRETALGILERAARYQSQHFNHAIRTRVSQTLPLFTMDRYAHLKLDEELVVQVFAAAKGDFMELEEISSGTQRQIILALRLALAQQLVEDTLRGGHFVMLDEPFAFFDPERTQAALQALPALSTELTQIWVSSQAFPSGTGFAKQIPITADATRISA